MTGYLRAAIALRVYAVLALADTVGLVVTGHLWWAGLSAWMAFLGVFLGGRCHLAHHRTLTDRTICTRYAPTNKENSAR